jgi:putative SOS response-associated peptidase YedK
MVRSYTDASAICHNLHVCGRYRLSRRKQFIADHFDATGDDDWEPRYNVAPTQSVSNVANDDAECSAPVELVQARLF